VNGKVRSEFCVIREMAKTFYGNVFFTGGKGDPDGFYRSVARAKKFIYEFAFFKTSRGRAN